MISIEEFLESMEAAGTKHQAIGNARNSLVQLNEYKQLDMVEMSDINKFIIHIRKEYGYTEGTISVRKQYIKKYFKMCGKGDMVESLTCARHKKHLDPGDIIDMNDVNNILTTMENDIEETKINTKMYQALIAVLWETGGRISEVLNVNKEKDLHKTDYGYEVRLLTEKTNSGYRTIPLFDSTLYLDEWMLHARKSDKKLFPITSRSVRNVLTTMKEKTGIKKPRNPHTFRHGAATQAVKDNIQESIIKAKFGWSADSKMLAVYITLAEDSVVQAELKRRQMTDKNITIPEPETVQMVKPVAESVVNELQAQNAVLMEKMANLEMSEEAIIERLMKRFPGLAGAEA